MTMAVLKLKSSDGTYLNYTLDKPITTLGRSKTNDIIIDDTSISRLHVRIENRNGQYFVIDNNSSNGTYLNRRKVSTAPLQDGDTLIAGQVQFHFSHKVIGGMKTQSLPLMDAGESPGRMSQTLAVSREDMPSHPTMFPSSGASQPPPMNPPPPQMAPSSMSAPTPREPQYGPSVTPPPGPVSPPPPTPPAFGNEPAFGSAPTPPPAFGNAATSPPPVSPPAYANPPAPVPPPPQLAPPTFASTPPPPAAPAGSASEMPYQNMLDPELFDVASPFSRLIAIIIDGFLPMLFAIPSIALSFMGMEGIGAILSILPLIAWLANFFGGMIKYGKTVGKHLMGIRIIDLDNPTKEGLAGGVVFKRLIGYIICGFTMSLLYLTILFDDEGRGFHDKFSNTKVVKY